MAPIKNKKILCFFNIILLLFLTLILFNCEPIINFEPTSTYYKELNLNGARINNVSMRILSGAQEVNIFIELICDKKRNIKIDNTISISNKYFYSSEVVMLDYKVGDSYWMKQSTFENYKTPYKLYGKELDIKMICFLKKRVDIKTNKLLSILKNTKFKIRLPSIFIDNKKFNFDDIDFVNSRLKK